MKKHALILGTGNSCRSQMAEGIWRQLAGEEWDVCSAGSAPSEFVHPLTLAAMSDIGIDITAYTSKHVNEFAGQSFDLVVTVCDGARGVLSGVSRRETHGALALWGPRRRDRIGGRQAAGFRESA